MKRFLEWFATRFLEERRISIGGDVYLRRFYLFGKMDDRLASLWNRGKRPKERFGFLRTTYLHCFHRPDHDRWKHNHPWPGDGWILTGGYVEQRYATHPSVSQHVVERVLMPGARQRLEPDTYHRVDALLDDVCWTLFRIGGKAQSWGYWDPVNNCHVPWQERHADSNDDPGGGEEG